jgi:hypothetical protein
LIRVEYSSLNYKDALSAKGNKGVTRNYPTLRELMQRDRLKSPLRHSGKVESGVGNRFDLGMNTNGGFGQYIVVLKAGLLNYRKVLQLKKR